MAPRWDAVVVGSGPNGLAAAIELATAGLSVLVLEGRDTPGGGMRTGEATLPGFLHDECSAIHPMARMSPFFREAPLAEHGLEWVPFRVSVAHPLDDRPSPLLVRSVEETGARLGPDADAWRNLLAPFLARSEELFADLLAPPRPPLGAPLRMARFALRGLRSASGLAGARFRDTPARALFAGCAAHSVLPLESPGSAAFGLIFSLAAHAIDWPCARGGSASIARALAGLLRARGGSVETGRPVRRLADLPDARVVLFDLSPAQVAAVAGPELPDRYLAALARFRYGPGVFKLDWALDGPIPWRDPIVGEASTVHVGGTLEEIAAAEKDACAGRIAERPFLILCQQSFADPSRAPEGKHTGYAYCHVPHGCDVDMTEAIETQVERFAPGFRERILARRALAPADLERLNPNYLGGSITGGAADLRQLIARPAWRWNPYTTPNPRLFLCSAATPPGGGVHGMCGVHAARAAMRCLRT